jgi:hypothetical protein
MTHARHSTTSMMMMMQMYYPCLWLALLQCLFHCPARAESQLGFRYDGIAACSSAAVTLENLAIDCDTTTGCLAGEEVTITSGVTTTLAMANGANLEVKACKFWGFMCTGTLLEQTVNLCDIFGSEAGDGEICAPAGTYDLDQTMTLPDWPLGNSYLAVDGVSFRIYVAVNQEFTCHAQFTTVRSDSTYSAVSFLPFAALLLLSSSGWYMYQRQQKRLKMRYLYMPTSHDHYVKHDNEQEARPYVQYIQFRQ